MLISVNLVVVLKKPGLNGRGELHVKIEDIYREGESEERYDHDGYDFENM